MLTPSEAARAVLDQVRPLPAESVPLREALDRVLADDVVSAVDIPPWDNSAMDGYAARRADLDAAGAGPVELQIVGDVPAGALPHRGIGPGECMRIFTGAPIPDGADTVVRQEDTEPAGPERVRIVDLRDAGRNVRPRGEDIRADAVVVPAGTPLGPAQIGVVASTATPTVRVHRRPRCAVLATGNELADLDEREAILAGRKIASSNSYTMATMVRRAGADVRDLGIARDDPDDLLRRLADAADCDLVVTSGGMSVGEHDHLRRLMEEPDAEMKFWRIRMRPGAPVGLGLRHGTPWIGLPGNPVSTMVTFELFVRPALRKLAGHRGLFRRTTAVRVGEPIRLAAPLRHFLRVRIVADGDALVALPTGPQGSGILSSMARADALLVVPEDRQDVAAGERLEAMLLDEAIHVPHPPF